MSDDAISSYLRGKTSTVEESGTQVIAEIGETNQGKIGRPCVCMFQGADDEIKSNNNESSPQQAAGYRKAKRLSLSFPRKRESTT
ncbi:MAG: hypothetical protein V1913_08010 [Fibrobacterota bacterium]